MTFSVSQVQWEQAAPLLRDVREKVFICEWRIPKRIEFDRKDPLAYHILVCDDQSHEPVATGRILPSGEISRIAVLMSFRHQHIDRVILKELFRIARELNLHEVFIHCPLEFVNFFVKTHFHTVGNVFMEAGIPRQRMACPIECVLNCNMSKFYLSH
ncbi:MAG: GNAT family N-acetyltransferase [Alteromonadaceae bacterium]|nr:GNAT family N-acetyltransferase [Alteromonadaceae bacterium]